MNMIESHWEEYRTLLQAPVKAEDREKHAFYAGAVAAFRILLSASNYSEKTGVEILDKVYREGMDFISQQESGGCRG